jgi:hypothetical protein
MSALIMSALTFVGKSIAAVENRSCYATFFTCCGAHKPFTQFAEIW